MGGNAVDAVVTTALCQGIMNPFSSGVGGGGFIVIHMANGSSSVVDAREVAPSGAHKNMYKCTVVVCATVCTAKVIVSIHILYIALDKIMSLSCWLFVLAGGSKNFGLYFVGMHHNHMC